MFVEHFPGSGDVKLVVVIPPESEPEQGGEVALELKSGERFPFRLDPRFFRVLRIVIEAAVDDRGMDMETIGVRSATRIARRYSMQVGAEATVQPEVIVRYVLQIRKAIYLAIDDVVSKGLIPRPAVLPKVIRTIRGRGYCLGDLDLTFIDYTRDAG